MSLVPVKEMAILRSASESKATADSALDEQQIMAVAHVINTAANTGEYTAIFQGKLRPNTIETLESNGYTIKYVNNNAYDMQKHALIIWRDVKPCDLVPEPSNSGPKYNIKQDDEVIDASNDQEEQGDEDNGMDDDSVNNDQPESEGSNG